LKGDTKPPDKRITLLLAISLILLLGRAGGWPLLIVVTALIMMIFLHELGHFVAAKISGMKVTEFFLGFGPKLWSFKRGETEYGVKAIPAGAYVRIIGMNNLEEVAPEDEPRTYRAQSYPKRFAVAVAGSTMHFAQALICIFLMLTITGAPAGHVFVQDESNWQIVEVVDGGAAKSAGLQPGDRVISVDGVTVNGYANLRELISARPGRLVSLVVDRHGEQKAIVVTLGNEAGQGRLGVRSGLRPEKVGVVTAAGRSFVEFGVASKEAVTALGSFFSPSGLSNFASEVVHGGSPAVSTDSGGGTGTSTAPAPDANRPISILGATRIGADLTEEGLFAFLLFFATINLFIGIVNLVPLLPLDGGHLVIATYERIRSC
jgi:membrane-associated protease RseP (regulator of RpoE activity)